LTTAISFFTGAGGLDIGLEQAGFNIRLALEIDPTYCDTLRLNYPSLNVREGDIMNYTKKRVFQEANISNKNEIDLVVGGSPCQSFSTAGKRKAFSDPRGQAMLKFANLVTDMQPKAFLLENVRGLLSASLKHRPLEKRGSGYPNLTEEEIPGSALKYLLSHFPDYEVSTKLLNAADYGVPQKRERVFIIGVRKDLNKTFNFPDTTHNEKGTNGKLPWKTVNDAFKRIKNTEHDYVNYSKERFRYMQMIPKGGGNWRNLRAYGEETVKEAMGGAYRSGGGKVGYFRRLYANRPSPTLLTSPIQKSTNLGHPFEDRPLSIQEYLVIQEFPVDYQIAGKLYEQYVQVGNAVPIRLAKILGESILNIISPNPIVV